MSLSVRGVAVSYPEQAFGQFNTVDAQKYVNDLKGSRLNSLDNMEGTIGTIDATSCIGVCYFTPESHIYVQHHDGRPCDNLVKIFEESSFKSSEPVKAVLVGGCRTHNFRGDYVHDFALLEQKYTRKNFEGLIAFWRKYNLNINLQGWVIGDDKQNATLCSDFVAGKQERIQLMQHGLAVQAGLVPEVARRSASFLSDETKYFHVYDSRRGNQLQLDDATNSKRVLRDFAQGIARMQTTEEVLKGSSTTPLLEPPHFVNCMRKLSEFCLDPEPAKPTTVELPKGPVIILQGEVGRLQPK